jgi:hypothetical protein
VCAELGENGPAVDRFSQPGGDSFAGPFGGAGPEWPGSSGESGGVAQLCDQGGALPVQVLDTSDVVVVTCQGEVLVEIGDAAAVVGACGGVEQGSAVGHGGGRRPAPARARRCRVGPAARRDRTVP